MKRAKLGRERAKLSYLALLRRLIRGLSSSNCFVKSGGKAVLSALSERGFVGVVGAEEGAIEVFTERWSFPGVADDFSMESG